MRPIVAPTHGDMKCSKCEEFGANLSWGVGIRLQKYAKLSIHDHENNDDHNLRWLD